MKSPVVQGQMLHALDQHTGGPDATRALAKAAPDAHHGEPVSATAKGTTVTYVNADGSKFTKHGNHPTRDNNPLDLETPGGFTARHGQIGKDKVFAIFPDVKTGLAAASALFDAKNNEVKFSGKATLADLIRSNSPAKDKNDTAGMIRDIPPAAGLRATDRWSNLTAEQRQTFVMAYARREGWHN